MVSVNILFFASARDAAQGKEQDTVTIESTGSVTLDAVVVALKERYPALERILQTAMLSVNEEYAEDDDLTLVTVKEGDEVAIIPPVSGG